MRKKRAEQTNVVSLLMMGLLNSLALFGHLTTQLLAQDTTAAVNKQAQGPDLSVIVLRSGEDKRPLLAPGQTFMLNLGIDNLKGAADAHSSVLTVKVPSGLILNRAVTHPDRVEPSADGTTLIWNLGTVKARAFPRLFALDLTVSGKLPVPTQLKLSAKAATTDSDVNPTHQNAVMTLYIEAPAADLTVQSDLEGVALTINEPVEFVAETSNEGNVSASGVALNVSLPPGITFKSGEPAPNTIDGNTLKWQIADIAPAASTVVNLTVAVHPKLPLAEPDATPAPESQLTFKFDASTTAVQANPGHAHLEITKRVEIAGADLKVWLDRSDADQPNPLPVGKDANFVIRYGNFGNRAASRVTVSLSLSQGLAVAQADPTPTHSTKNDNFLQGVLSWDVGDLRVGDSKEISCRVHVASVPDYGSSVMATITAPGTDINPANNSAFFYGYPPNTASGGALGKALTGGQTGHASVLWRLLLLLALATSVWFVFRKMRRRTVP